MAVRTQRQLANRRRIERLIRFAAPGLDLVLFVGDQISKVAGRDQIAPEPARRSADHGAIRTPIAGPARRTPHD